MLRDLHLGARRAGEFAHLLDQHVRVAALEQEDVAPGFLRSRASLRAGAGVITSAGMCAVTGSCLIAFTTWGLLTRRKKSYAKPR